MYGSFGFPKSLSLLGRILSVALQGSGVRSIWGYRSIKEHTMDFFFKKVDLRSRKTMENFLSSHFQYYTMSSWNGVTSYANCIKITQLGLTNRQIDNAFDLLSAEDYWDEIRFPIDQFTEDYNGQYTIGVNGRSGGYLVLYKSEYKSTGHKSFCPCCGQRNYKKVPPSDFDLSTADGVIADEVLHHQRTLPRNLLDKFRHREGSGFPTESLSDEDLLNKIIKATHELKDCSANGKCGHCGSQRINYMHEPRQLATFPGQGTCEPVDFDDLSMEDLRDSVKLVQSFDQACDYIRDNFINLLDACKVIETTIMIPKTIRQLSCQTM